VISYIDQDGNTQTEAVTQEAYSFIMNQEWINAINSNGSIDGFNITIRDCLESDYESNWLSKSVKDYQKIIVEQNDAIIKLLALQQDSILKGGLNRVV